MRISDWSSDVCSSDLKGIKAARHGLQYLLWRTGLLTSNVIESGAFVDTNGSGRPDNQIHVTPRLVGDFDREPPPRHGTTHNPCILRPPRSEVRRVWNERVSTCRSRLQPYNYTISLINSHSLTTKAPHN